MNSGGTYNNRSDRVRSTITGMEYGSAWVDRRSTCYAALRFHLFRFLFLSLQLLPFARSRVRSHQESYLETVYTILGKKSGAVCSFFLRFGIFKVGVVYTITSAISMRAIRKSNCYHKEGHTADCEYEITCYILFFGIVQTIVSQIPNFRDTEWLSIISAIMSFSYAIIGSALGIARTISNGVIKGSSGKTWLIAQALGNIAFAFPFSVILLNIQDTLKSPPSEKVTMKKASTIGIITTTIFTFVAEDLDTQLLEILHQGIS